MKKQFLIIALALAATSLAAQDWHYEYNEAEQTATVVSWDRWHDTDHGEAYGHDNCYEGDLVIPDKAPNGYAVTAIGPECFLECRNLTFIQFPSTLKRIEEGAFMLCTALPEHLSFPASLEYIGSGAYSGCISVRTLTIDDSDQTLTVAGSGMVYGAEFYNLESLETIYVGRNIVCEEPTLSLFGWQDHVKDITFGEKVTTLPAEVCINSTGLKHVKLSNAITVIPDRAFSGCEWLESIEYADLTSIGEESFVDCRGLLSFNFPSTLKSIGVRAFDACENLSSQVVIPISVEHIGSQAFSGCNSVKQLTIEDSDRPLTVGTSGWNQTFVFSCFNQVEQVYIGRNVVCDEPETPEVTLFAGFEHPFELTFGDLVTELPKEACAYSAGLKKLTIGDGIKLIPEMAFCSCTGLETFSLGRSVEAIGTSAFDGCFGLQQWYYHNSLKSIGSSAFYAYPMPYLNLGPSIEYIGEDAFAQSAIQEITCQGTVAPVCEGWVFDGMSPLATLYIPKGAKPAYENAECWKEFFAEEKVVEFTPTAIDAVEYNGNKLSHLTSHPSSSLWYTIDGRQLSGEPSSAGIYLHDGRAVVKK